MCVRVRVHVHVRVGSEGNPLPSRTAHKAGDRVRGALRLDTRVAVRLVGKVWLAALGAHVAFAAGGAHVGLLALGLHTCVAVRLILQAKGIKRNRARE